MKATTHLSYGKGIFKDDAFDWQLGIIADDRTSNFNGGLFSEKIRYEYTGHRPRRRNLATELGPVPQVHDL